MRVNASLRHIRITPRKAMLVANLIRGLGVNDALSILKYSKRQRAAKHFVGLLRSAIANADQLGKIDVDTLFVERLEVGKGPTLKRFRAKSMGRAGPIEKKTSHVFLTLSER